MSKQKKTKKYIYIIKKIYIYNKENIYNKKGIYIKIIRNNN